VVKPSQAEEERKATAKQEPPRTAPKELAPAEQEKKLREATDKINRFVESITRDLQFSFDKEAHRMVVKVLERESGEVIRQIPSEEILSIAKALDTLQGLIIREKV